jgi:hypothetical protein
VALICPTAQAKYFCEGGLDAPNHVESPHEIPVLAHSVCTPESLRERGDIGKIELICPRRENQSLSSAVDGAIEAQTSTREHPISEYATQGPQRPLWGQKRKWLRLNSTSALPSTTNLKITDMFSQIVL